MQTWEDLVWGIGDTDRPMLSTYSRDVCDYVLHKLGEDGVDTDSFILQEDLTKAEGQVHELFEQAIRHKRYECNHAPSHYARDLGEYCDSLEQKIEQARVRV